MTQKLNAVTDPLSPIERAIVSALVSAIVKEFRAEQSQPGRQSAA